jgi:transcriptional regulator with XRE-family HTH domain
VSPRGSPTVRRRRLGIELRQLRESAMLTIEDVARILECSASKVSRIETGQVGATTRDVRDMLEIYGVKDPERDALIQLTREAREKGWWHAYGDDLHFAAPYVGLEAAAASIRTYDTLVVPGLLQTPEYARAVLRAVLPDRLSDEIERRVRFRLARQSLLTEDDPPSLWMVLDEALLHRSVGGPEVMREQLHRLIEAASLPNITLQILAFRSGEHAGMDGAFTILGFVEPADPDVVYLENATSDLYLERSEEIQRYALLFNHLRAAALKPDDSLVLLAGIAKEL